MTAAPTSPTPYRCAVYFVPDVHSPWWQAGSAWLGRCAATNQPLAQPPLAGISPQAQHTHTSEPRRYGWHATLKAPFQLAPHTTLEDVLSGVRTLAQSLSAFDLPPLQLSTQGGFLSLRPEGDVSTINQIAAACVTQLHAFAAPLGEAELARRRKAPLTPTQERLLLQWGYPYVLDEFSFHLTLTNKLDGLSPEECEAWWAAAHHHFADLGTCRFDRLALCVEPHAGGDFQLLSSVELSP